MPNIPITVKAMKDLSQEALEDAYDAVRGRRWVVHLDYDVSEMRWRIAEVKPWHIFRTYHPTRTILIKDAPDELGAYTQALEILEKGE